MAFPLAFLNYTLPLLLVSEISAVQHNIGDPQIQLRGFKRSKLLVVRC